MEVFRNLLVAVLLLGLVVVPILKAQDDSSSGEQFFAGLVTEYTGSRIYVSRTVRGQTEGRSFRVTSSTRIDGYLTTGVRVTVRYAYEGGGETATMIIVRTRVRD